jgi:hypothetical protein
MKYFLHDTNSFDDEKITELYLRFGYEGLGLFYTALEKMGKQEKPVKTDILKAQLRVGKKLNKCWNFMEEIGLLSSNNGETFNKQLLNFSEKYQIKKEKNRIKVLQWRKEQEDKENVTSYEQDCNARKVNKSKVNINKENKEKTFLTFDFINPEYRIPFEKWIEHKKARKEMYKSEVSLKACYNKLVNLSENDPAAANEIVNNSLANNWAGLFKVKDNHKFKNKEDEITDDIVEKVNAGIQL